MYDYPSARSNKIIFFFSLNQFPSPSTKAANAFSFSLLFSFERIFYYHFFVHFAPSSSLDFADLSGALSAGVLTKTAVFGGKFTVERQDREANDFPVNERVPRIRRTVQSTDLPSTGNEKTEELSSAWVELIVTTLDALLNGRLLLG